MCIICNTYASRFLRKRCNGTHLQLHTLQCNVYLNSVHIFEESHLDFLEITSFGISLRYFQTIFIFYLHLKLVNYNYK